MMETIPRAALWLGVAGALPFWMLAVALAYGGLMLSFLGGIRWGVALGAPDERQRARAMIGGAVPVLMGLAAFFLAPPIGLSLIIIALFVQALAEAACGHFSPCSPSFR
jgi:hypothetical protein